MKRRLAAIILSALAFVLVLALPAQALANQVDSSDDSTGKEEQRMTATVLKPVVTEVKLENQAIKLKNVIRINNAHGALTYSKENTAKKYEKFKVNAKTGTIKVPKGTKVGTYKVKVKVTAAGDEAYEPGSINVTVKIRCVKDYHG